MKKVLFVFAIAAAFAACNNASESTPAADSTKVDTPAVAPAPAVDTTAKVADSTAAAPAADTTKK